MAKLYLINFMFSTLVSLLYAFCTNHKPPPGAERAEGDPCTENFYSVDADRIFGCEFDVPAYSKAGGVFEKTCDFMTVAGFLKWDQQKKEFSENTDYIKWTAKHRLRAAAAKVKLWLQVGSDAGRYLDEIRPRDLSDVIGDAAARKRLINLILDTLQKYEMDGVFINWKYPGCPGTKCESAFLKDRASAITFFKELAVTLLSLGKVVANTWEATELDMAKYLGPDFQQLLTKYVNYTLFNTGGLGGIWKNTLDTTRNIQKMEQLMGAIFTNVGPSLKKKAILMRELQFNIWILLSPHKNSIGSKFNSSASQNYLPLKRWCETFRNDNFTRVPNSKTQSHAYSSTHWIAYEDYEHARAEVERIIKKFDMAGFFMDMVMQDDLVGDCRAGRIPYTRMYAEALKGGSCIFKPFL